MSLDAIAQVTAAEEATRVRLLEAQAAAKQVVQDAQREGKSRMEEARRHAEAEAGALLAAAETRSADHAKTVLAQAQGDGNALRAEAALRLDKAADLIIERVVNG